MTNWLFFFNQYDPESECGFIVIIILRYETMDIVLEFQIKSIHDPSILVSTDAD